jgi:hypothetical protein
MLPRLMRGGGTEADRDQSKAITRPNCRLILTRSAPRTFATSQRAVVTSAYEVKAVVRRTSSEDRF